MSISTRLLVQSLVRIQNPADAHDLENPAKTRTDLVALVQRAVDSPAHGGLGYELIATCINSSHSDDSCLGPHGHRGGFAIDVWPADEDRMGHFLADMANNNRWVVKIGLGGSAKAYRDAVSWGNTIVFEDNDTDHVHLQSA